ncbi:transmembrane protein 80-like [Stegastes partitus]|uniref:Transmembrane protein 80-like n=1 Tax=Stegastes partitus TaxID=144197 RepID=A0A9Y4U2Q8_9TELE|nr:PREDICTED: transmembrane protein 80-like [Stegastes partitus]XP_008304695.1 PREDICTED: transmembrane protein 80-like [Stegastes partitus]
MATAGAGRSAGVLSSVPLQILLKLTAVYFVLYFLFTLSLIIRKSLLLSYPADAVLCDVGLLFLLAALEFLHFFSGVKGNLAESEGYILANLVVTGTTILLTVYFLVWQTYVMRADVIISSILVVVYGLDGFLAFSTLARLASVYS